VTTQSARANVESILQLSPNQRAMLLARSLQPEDPGFIQVTFTLSGNLDLARYESAWREVVTRHPSLRASARDRKDADPLIVVWRAVDVPFDVDDWRGDEEDRQQARWDAMLAQDRMQDLDPASEPVMRLRIIRLAEDRHRVLWSSHHLFVDGWSAAIVLEDVIAAYRSLGGSASGREPTSPEALTEYTRWVSQRDDHAAESFWKGRLAGYRGTPRFRIGSPLPTARGFEESTIDLDPELVSQISEVCGRTSITLNAFVQTAWALVVGALFGTDDVVFGTSVAGRAVPIDGVERLVGYLTNAVPIRTKIDKSRTLRATLQAARDAQFEIQPFEHVPLDALQGWTDVPGHRELFETFLMVANYPFDASGRTDHDDVTHSEFDSGLTTAFPITVAVDLGSSAFVRCRFDSSRCATEAAATLMERFVDAMAAMVATPLDMPVSDLDPLLSAPWPPVDETAPGSDGRSLASDPPRDDVELRLVRLWQTNLDIDGLGIHDDYFSLGGTSIAAVRLFGSIEDEFGKRLPLSALITRSTVAQLAPLLRGEEASESEWRTLVPIQVNGDEPPIACVHPNTGEVLFYRSLATHLGNDQPLIGVKPLGLDGTEDPIESIPDMAALYTRELKSVQPHGPYRLVGYCLGATLALEMARQFEADGETVELLAMIDPPRLEVPSARERAARIRKSRGLVALTRTALVRLRHAVSSRLRRHVGHRWDRTFGGATGRRRLDQERVRVACGIAAGRYHAEPVAAPIAYIYSSDGQDTTTEWMDQWRRLTPDFRTYPIDSGHTHMLEEPAVASVARAINAELGGDAQA
jgi:thioesterase domain-containing protein/acyl carrier protein